MSMLTLKRSVISHYRVRPHDSEQHHQNEALRKKTKITYKSTMSCYNDTWCARFCIEKELIRKIIIKPHIRTHTHSVTHAIARVGQICSFTNIAVKWMHIVWHWSPFDRTDLLDFLLGPEHLHRHTTAATTTVCIRRLYASMSPTHAGPAIASRKCLFIAKFD